MPKKFPIGKIWGDKFRMKREPQVAEIQLLQEQLREIWKSRVEALQEGWKKFR